MTAVRAVALVAVLVALCGSQAAALSLAASCPASAKDAYNHTSCAAALACQRQRCTCAGNRFNENNQTCTHPHGTPYSGCSLIADCQKAFLTCMHNAAQDSSCTLALNDLRLSLFTLQAGSAYAGSVAQLACQRETCLFYNLSASSPTACDLAYATTCTEPAKIVTQAPTTTRRTTTTARTVTTARPGSSGSTTARPAGGATTARPGSANTTRAGPTTMKRIFYGIMRLNGNFSAILKSATASAALSKSLATDMTKQFQCPTTVTGLKEGSLAVEFAADLGAGGVSDAQFSNRVDAASGSTDWLASTQATYTANGGTGSLTVLGIGADPSKTTLAPGQTARPATTVRRTTPAPTGASATAAIAALVATVAAVLVA